MASTLPSFEVNLKVFTKDCPDLEPEVLDELCFFLEKVQENPYSPDLLSRSERRGSKYAAEFLQGFVVYWKLRESSPGKVTSIDVLKVAKIADIL